MQIDLRSDTVTKPSQQMLEAMFQAQVGDDVFNEDPSIQLLQEQAAQMFGMQAALFCPSGTMCNQIAIRISTQPQDQVICDQYAHVYMYEGGGMALNSSVTARRIKGDRGRITVEQIQENINPDDIHLPRTALVCLENTSNKGGGSCYSMDQIEAISKLCKDHELKLHLDGARLMNAIVAKEQNPTEYGKYFDTISLCLSKGLGAPVGSVLLGSEKAINAAKRVRKVMGGGMRQAGYLAAAGSYALQHHVTRLAEDHRKAQEIGKVLANHPLIDELLPIETNIIIFSPKTERISAEAFRAKLTEAGILSSPFGQDYIRFVTHLDISDTMLQKIILSLQQIKS